MNKQQLASTIWKSANALRSNIAANEYKDYILGFIFYRFLSEKVIKFALAEGYEEDNLREISADDPETLKYFQERLGYFIDYKHLFSTWQKMKTDFDIACVREALSSFERLISPTHKKVFAGIFDTLSTGLSKLGDSAASQTKAVNKLFKVIDKIPMDNRQGYDVLGFIYEYLLRQFAANAGKAGEFYTPHEAAVFMAEIIAAHLKNKSSAEIYDPTSGSGSLLLNIGNSLAQNMTNTNKIKYYAQELIGSTYNLTRMNLVMRDIIPENIIVRQGDTLDKDWPFFDESDPVNSYKPLYVDAVVSNPPYSQPWDIANRDNDPRFSGYGLAPKGKADLAFLLHGLYHLKPEGIMTIVMPHGILFRGSSKKDDPTHGDAEWEIRRALVENNRIDAIIGLPSNMFFGTGIATIVVVLKKERSSTDVLFVDASRGFEKIDTKNQLRAQDVKKIVDAVTLHHEFSDFSRLVPLSEIRNNDYNLNIPRYISGSDDSEHIDIRATMFGGIPDHEIDLWNAHWNVFTGLREKLFEEFVPRYKQLAVTDLAATINSDHAVCQYKTEFANAFNGFREYLRDSLLDQWQNLSIAAQEKTFSDYIFEHIKPIPLLDEYEAYQQLDNHWKIIEPDLWTLRIDGWEAAKTVEPLLKEKKKKNEEEVEYVQEGWVGKIFPFDLVQRILLPTELAQLNNLKDEINKAAGELEGLLGELSEDEQNLLLNDENDAFDSKKVTASAEKIFADAKTPETLLLDEYLKLSKKKDKQDFIAAHPELQWDRVESNKDGTCGKPAVVKLCKFFKSTIEYPHDSTEYRVITAEKLLETIKSIKAKIKASESELEAKTKETIESLTDEQIRLLLEEKWIVPLVTDIFAMPKVMLKKFIADIKNLSCKYDTTLLDIDSEISAVENGLHKLLGDLTGHEDDIVGIQALQQLLGGE